MKKIFRTSVVSALIFFIGVGVGHVLTGSKPVVAADDRSERHLGESTDSLTNPLLECEFGSEYLSKHSIRPFKAEIEGSIDRFIKEGKATHISYYFRDLNNGSWFGFNEKENFSPASLLKVPLLIHILARAESEPGVLMAQIEYAGGDADAPQFVLPKNPIQIGKTYTVAELLEHMIVESDNNAALLLTQFTGIDRFKTIFTEFGIALPPAVENTTGSMSVRDYAAFFRVLFNASYLSQRASEGALTLLTQSKFKEGIITGVPENILVAHKFGEREFEGQKQLHDCGIVYEGKSPYLLCIMTRGDDFTELERVIAALSKTTYEQVHAQAR